jgi:hypothetical protein
MALPSLAALPTWALFSYNITSHVFSNLNLFTGPNGAKPCGTLLELDQPMGILPVPTTGAQLQIWPNPTTGLLMVQLPGTESSYAVEVHNTLGQMVEQFALTGGKNSIDLTNQPAGIYFVETRTGAGVVSGKVVVGR